MRELRGEDEDSVTSSDTLTTIEFLDRLLVNVQGAAVLPGAAATLCAADRDRMLVAIYRDEIGPRIAASPRCENCHEQFDLDFELDALVASLDRPTSATPGRVDIGDAIARIPTGSDEIAAANAPDPIAELRARCVVKGSVTLDALAAALEEAAPMVDLDLDATCPSCGSASAMSFSIQDYLLGTLLAEHSLRAREIHLLARTYGWSLSEIQSLPRTRRRAFVELVEREGAR